MHEPASNPTDPSEGSGDPRLNTDGMTPGGFYRHSAIWVVAAVLSLLAAACSSANLQSDSQAGERDLRGAAAWTKAAIAGERVEAAALAADLSGEDLDALDAVDGWEPDAVVDAVRRASFVRARLWAGKGYRPEVGFRAICVTFENNDESWQGKLWMRLRDGEPVVRGFTTVAECAGPAPGAPTIVLELTTAGRVGEATTTGS